jgi:hypothetical protein
MVINNTTTSISFFPFTSFDGVSQGGGGNDSFLLLESGDFLLQEDGSKFVLSYAGGTVDVEVWHKNTKTMVEAESSVTIVGSKVTVTLPSLSNITAVAQDLDTILIRIKHEGKLMWEYVATWSTESTNINNTFKNWDTTADESPEWITI